MNPVLHRSAGPNAGLLLTFLLATGASADPARFDFNAPASPTLAGWTPADLGNGFNGTVSVATVAIGAVTVDSRDRGATNGGGTEAAMWSDFVFANGSFSSVAGSGLRITISGLIPNAPYPITIWAFDDTSAPAPAGANRSADWSAANDGAGGRLDFPDGPDPATLLDYRLNFKTVSDASGTIVLSGIVTATNPSSSHNVFINGLEIDDPLFDEDGDGLPDPIEQAIIDADPADDLETLADVLPGDDFDGDGSSNLEESERGTDATDEDTDDDGLLDGVEDGGGTWVSASQTGTDPMEDDTDGDGLLDGEENHDLSYDPGNPTGQPGTDPNLVDTDADGVRDGTEIFVDFTDPTDPASFFDPLGETTARFDFNAPGSPTQIGWTAADAGNGSDGTVSVATEAIGGVTLDTRDRLGINTDTGNQDNEALWCDFVFANGSFDTAPGSGLRLTISGLKPNTTYPIAIWAFDESSNAGRSADWGVPGESTLTLSFPTSPDPASLGDYTISFEVTSDAGGEVVIEGIVAAVAPSTSHNVFVNALAIGVPLGSNRVRIIEIARSPGDGSLGIRWESKGGMLYNVRSATALSEPPLTWPVFAGNEGLEATPPENSVSFPLPPDAERFFVVEEFPAPPVVIFSDDFESGQGGWTVGSDGQPGTAWELGTPTAVGPPAAYSPANCFGTNLSADYAPDALVWLRSPAIDLSTAGSATLSYFNFRDLEDGYDYGRVAILDATDDTILAVLEMEIDGLTVDWEKVTKRLPPAALGQTIKIEFQMESDDVQVRAGWYIDDVVLTVP